MGCFLWIYSDTQKLSCEDQGNRGLPYPIKICRYRENAEYGKLMPSMGDLGQGL